MKGLWRIGMILVGASLLVSCHKADTVQADFQPRQAPDAIARMKLGKYGHREIDGLLRGIDVQSGSMVMEVENGMDQTFKWDEDTEVTGIDPAKATNSTPTTIALMKELATRPGSEITVEWRDEGYDRVATSIDVIDVTKKTTPKSRRKMKIVR